MADLRVVRDAAGEKRLIDSSKCFFPAGCPGCGNCDPFVPMTDEAAK